MRLLTFNWHETYLTLLARLGHTWDVVLRPKAGRQDWWTEVRPVPANVTLVDEAAALTGIARGDYDAVVCHNLLDLGLVVDSGIPTATIFHTSRDLELRHGLDPAAFDRYGLPLIARTTPVFVSPMKQRSWGLDGVLIPPGVPAEEYGGYTGQLAQVLHVGNLKRELASVNGMAELQTAVAGLPFTLVGLNPTIPGAGLSHGWDDLKSKFRSHRVYIHTTRAPFEDGYNLGMLEAMATGMPVVTLAHESSPIVDRVNGIVGQTARELSVGLLELLEDPDRAKALGAQARDTVRTRFSLEAFVHRWTAVLNSLRGDRASALRSINQLAR